MQCTRQSNYILVPFIKEMIEFNNGAWAISAAAHNLGPINVAGLKKNQEFQGCHLLNI